jgi:hypothetical protein
MSIRNIFKQTKLNLSLAILFALIIFAALVASPKIDKTLLGKHVYFDGIDFTDLSNGKIVREFEFQKLFIKWV